MERSFSCFGHSQRFRVDSALGLDDQQTQIDEINDIEAFLPDMTLEMITPKPEDIQTLRNSLEGKSRDWVLGFYLYSKVEMNEESFDIKYEVHLPAHYPSMDEPLISFFCASLTPDITNKLINQLKKRLTDNQSPNGVLLEAIDWLSNQIQFALLNREKPFSEIESVPFLR